MADPPLAGGEKGLRNHYSNKDPAMRLVDDGSLKFKRPWISAGGLKFTWPVGTEGFRVSGQATVGLHRYIGANTATGHVIHFNEGRIEIRGTLPGLTSPGNMVTLQDVCMARNNKKMLALPGILPKVQYVIVESYDFDHAEDDRTSSITYSITLLRTGNTGSASASGGGGNTLEAAQTASAAPMAAQKAPTSKADRVFTVTQGVDTFRLVADRVYGNSDLWTKLVDLNRDTLINNNPGMIAITIYQLPYYRWPVGTRIVY